MSLSINKELLYSFEEQLNPLNMEDSPVKAELVGYGEISSIFKLGNDRTVVYKRLPIFNSPSDAERYSHKFFTYSEHLSKAGLKIPEQKTVTIEIPGRPVSLYIAQEAYPVNSICNNKLHLISEKESLSLIQGITDEVKKVWDYNEKHRGEIELSLDSQISNWVYSKTNGAVNFYYIDTSTPLYRVGGVEQFEPEPFLKSSPPGLRWILRKFFLTDVMNRYYDYSSVLIDLVANLYKEQKAELISSVVDTVTGENPELKDSVTVETVKAYYKEDKMIWSLFLAFRKADRFIKRMLGKRYEFILPGKIKR